jgi:hypothetical protein
MRWTPQQAANLFPCLSSSSAVPGAACCWTLFLYVRGYCTHK